MPHLRDRHVLPLFKKRLKFSRVVTIQGSRQSGKSVLAKDLLAKSLPKASYLSFDQKSTHDFASSNPETFLEQHSEALPLMIDEAQKVPAIFDAIKLKVDSDPRPGQFLLLGSTEFSKQLKIREALTGRMTRIRLFSMNAGECLEIGPSPGAALTLINEKPRLTRADWIKHVHRGGFPGIFAVRDEHARRDLLQDWIELTAYRDLQQFQGVRVDSELALRMLSTLATAEEPTASEIARILGRDTRVVQRILNLLQILFVVHQINPHPLGIGKPYYFLCDSSLAAHFKASYERLLVTWVLHEYLSQSSYRSERNTVMNYYRNSRGNLVHFILQDERTPKSLTALKILDSEKFDSRNFEILKALRVKAEKGGLSLRALALGPSRLELKADEIDVHPWESLA